MIAAIVVCTAITFGLRFIPIQVAHRYRDREDLKEISSLLPAGLMLILVAYTLLEAESGTQLSRLVLGAVGSLIVHFLTRNFLVSFLTGFVVFVVAGKFL